MGPRPVRLVGHREGVVARGVGVMHVHGAEIEPVPIGDRKTGAREPADRPHADPEHVRCNLALDPAESGGFPGGDRPTERGGHHRKQRLPGNGSAPGSRAFPGPIVFGVASVEPGAGPTGGDQAERTVVLEVRPGAAAPNAGSTVSTAAGRGAARNRRRTGSGADRIMSAMPGGVALREGIPARRALSANRQASTAASEPAPKLPHPGPGGTP